MAERKTPNKGYQKLKSDLSAGNIGQVYIFYGEESYLREYYLGEIKKKLVPAGFEEFNYHRLSGKTLTMQELNEAVEAMPMMAERTLFTKLLLVERGSCPSGISTFCLTRLRTEITSSPSVFFIRTCTSGGAACAAASMALLSRLESTITRSVWPMGISRRSGRSK